MPINFRSMPVGYIQFRKCPVYVTSFLDNVLSKKGLDNNMSCVLSKIWPLYNVHPEPVFLNVYGAKEAIPRNEFRQPM